MDTQLDNDTRGWVMCTVSGIACVIGASIICVDVLIRCIPSKRNFRIQDSDVFLASSLSLSFGVMIFSALYSMLPSSKKYLERSGSSPSKAAWILLAGFMGGFVGIQIVSRFLHHHMPSHVVECDHTHDEAPHDHEHGRSRAHSHTSHGSHRGHSQTSKVNGSANGNASETTPLVSSANGSSGKLSPIHAGQHHRVEFIAPRIHTDAPSERRPSMIEVQAKRVMSFVKDTKPSCDSNGTCFGFGEPCGQECYKNVNLKTPTSSRSNTTSRANTVHFCREHAAQHDAQAASLHDEHPGLCRSSTSTRAIYTRSFQESDEACESDSEDLEAQHHHHVPENAFMSIGLQTSIAIALHKLPEGFITYATNHANPSLGFSIFMALFVHNITEGFAMALPLYLALQSRPRAMIWASLLGGVSQPLGAGIAAAWFKIAGHKGNEPGEGIYGIMFAVTAGIMVSVAMQLFVEGLSLNHNRNLCIGFGFVGMAIMGLSNALTS